MNYSMREASLTPELAEELIRLSGEWEAEDSCRGYRKNGIEDLEGRRIFLLEEQGRILAYLFGLAEKAKNCSSVMPEGTPCFEVEELYVRPDFRSRGLGAALFRHVEAALRDEAEYLTLSTATKNWRAILHFYLEELELSFWSARLFKKLR